MHRSRILSQLIKHCHKTGHLDSCARLISSSSSRHGASEAQAGVRDIAKAPWARAALAAFAVTSAGLGYTAISSSDNSDTSSAAQCHGPAAINTAGLPEYSKEDVAKHKTKENRVWVTYKDGVYDVTEWIDQHPGGSVRVMMAAGGAIDPYWAMYAQHNTDQVRGILEGYRIGRLKGGAPPVENPYANEPERLAALQVRSKQPMNAETPLEFLADALITPNELFYIRNHLPVPEVDLKNYKLHIGGEGLRELTFTLDNLKTMFKKHSITAVLQCTGNRRADLQKEPGAKEIKGLAWEGAAIGNAVWSGVLLKDVLAMAGVTDTTSDPAVQHIQFEGLDHDTTGMVYGASIPISKALDPRGDVLLAFEMNGEPLNRDHGAPLRVIVPGVAACRSVKWLSKIIASPEESRSFWQREDYKSFSPSVDWDNVDWDSAPAIQNMPITSQICYPANGTTVDVIGGAVTVKGYAWSGGGNGIIRVDVSSDDGKNWTTAELKKVPQEVNRGWSWTLWEAEVPLPEKYEKGTQVTITAKAVDESYNTQPERADAIWNLRGVCCNTWPKVLITPEE
jgi:sulfite oxidase